MEIFNTITDQERFIGEMLIERGYLDQNQLEEIMDSAEKNETKFGESAIQLGYVNEEDFLKVFSEQILTPYVDLKFFNIERSALEFLDKETARRLIAVPLFEAGNTLAIGFHDPLNLDAILYNLLCIFFIQYCLILNTFETLKFHFIFFKYVKFHGTCCPPSVCRLCQIVVNTLVCVRTTGFNHIQFKLGASPL